MKVLVVVPMAPKPPRLYAATYASIVELQCDGHLDIIWMRHDGSDGHYSDLADKLNGAAAVAQWGGYDAMLIVEYDMIVPPDALQKLLQVDADIAYGLYCSRVTAGHNWLMVDDIDDYSITWPTDAERRASWGNVVTSCGVGTGCTLIRTDALENLAFRIGTTGAPDWSLATDAKRLGLRQAHHCGVVCGHIMDERRILWPDPDQPEMYRIDERDNLLLLAADQRYRVQPGHAVVKDRIGATYRPGEVVELDPNQAALLVRKGIVVCA